MMKNMKKISERGTLMVEAIAMLGLIAMVTPTLYKKSAERMQDIQDINEASQVRTMHNIIETFMNANFTGLMEESSSRTGRTIKLSYNDGSSGSYSKGYSSYVPFGYNMGDIKSFRDPDIYVHSDGSTLVSFIVFPSVVNPGRKRISHVASLVGANGGVVGSPMGASSSSMEFMGTGHAWYLDNEMLDAINLKTVADGLPENSLVVTSSEPVTQASMESDKFLYRGPDGGKYHNTMVTDLFMGGHAESTEWNGRADSRYYSIYNVRKLTLNTRCNESSLTYLNLGGTVDNCEPDVADLYIGKPFGDYSTFSSEYTQGIKAGNTGAAWIYGNLSALNRNFKLFRDGGDNDWSRDSGHDVLQFARMTEDTDTVEYEVLRADNTSGSSSVRMMDGFVQVLESGEGSSAVFMVGGSSSVGGEGAFIQAESSGGRNEVRINSPVNATFLAGEEPTTLINSHGGVVRINGGSAGVLMETYINDAGGVLAAGSSAAWIRAGNSGYSSEVILLGGQDMLSAGSSSVDKRTFLVGTDNANENYMFYGDAEKAALRGGQVRVYTPEIVGNYDTSSYGGAVFVQLVEGEGASITTEGATAVLSRYTDILGSTYMGSGSMTVNGSDESPDFNYSRGEWALGVAGNAWIDQFLWARRAWFNEMGGSELHAGFDNSYQYWHNPQAGWLNVYNDSIVVRDKDRALAHSSEVYNEEDVMMVIDSSRVYFRDHDSARVELRQGQAFFGNDANYFYADSSGATSSAAHMVGSTLASVYTTGSSIAGRVNIQKDAMIFSGHGSSGVNKIEANAGMFTITTADKGGDSADVQFYADGTDIRTRFVNFSVEDDTSSAVFRVMPNEGQDSSNANVHIKGTLLVNDNDVVHITSNGYNGTDGEEGENRHAMLEISPDHVQVWGKSGGSYAGGSSDSYYALLKVNPQDISGAASNESDRNASVYVRRGAIELMQSESSSTNGYAADEGFGYIMANRLVSNSNVRKDVPTTGPDAAEGNVGENYRYDQYMVNPAYTSVMHDIKLTTRGGARLSDALPDYVLKGVYNLINNCAENATRGSVCDVSGMDTWADPYIGIIPLAICPPGYANLATVVPISFQVGNSGRMIHQGGGRYQVDFGERQANILKAAKNGTGGSLVYPELHEVEGYVVNWVAGDLINLSSLSSYTETRTEGWFWGYDAVHDNSSWTHTISELGAHSSGVPTYSEDGTQFDTVVEPLYFQQNTWLKTSVEPVSGKGWHAYMGFLYNDAIWGGLGGLSAPVNSNVNEAGGGNEEGGASLSGYYWNVFPVPTNSLEGHATVYCYFDRKKFEAYGNLVDQTDNLANVRAGGNASRIHENSYVERLNDPTLKYTDPW